MSALMFLPSKHLTAPHGKWRQTAKHVTKTRARQVFKDHPKSVGSTGPENPQSHNARVARRYIQRLRAGYIFFSSLHPEWWHTCSLASWSYLTVTGGHVVPTSFYGSEQSLTALLQHVYVPCLHVYLHSRPSFYPPIQTCRLFTLMEHIAGEIVRVSSTHCASTGAGRALSGSKSPLQE